MWRLLLVMMALFGAIFVVIGSEYRQKHTKIVVMRNPPITVPYYNVPPQPPISPNREPISVEVPDVRHLQGLYNDPLSHATNDLGDPHENTHQVNSQVRNQLMQQHGGNNWNAVYVLRGKAFPIQEPPFTLQKVASAVPSDKRDRYTFALYLQRQVSGWNSHPCYILDEWAAYLNGIECDLAKGKRDQIAYWLECANEFDVYAAVLDGLASQSPGYDATQLHAVIQYQHQRTMRLAEQISPTRLGEIRVLTKWCLSEETAY